MFWVKFLICLVVLSPLLIAGYNFVNEQPKESKALISDSPGVYYCIENYVYMRSFRLSTVLPVFNSDGRAMSCDEWRLHE